MKWALPGGLGGGAPVRRGPRGGDAKGTPPYQGTRTGSPCSQEPATNAPSPAAHRSTPDAAGPARPRRLLLATGALLLLALAARLPYLPRLGQAYDLEAYRQWTAAIQEHGLAEVFDRTDTDYVGYHYILWAIGKGLGVDAAGVTVRDKGLRLWLKAPGLVGDLLSTAVVVGLASTIAVGAGGRLAARQSQRLAGVLRLRDTEALALGAGFLWALNPALIYTGAYWGQNDSLVTAFALGAVWAALRRRPALAAVLLVAGGTIKPQPLLVAPALAWIVLQRSGLRGACRAAIAGAAALLAGHLYFILTGNLDRVALIYRDAVLTPQRLSFSAYNLWWPVARTRDPTSADVAVTLGPVDVAWGTLAAVLVAVVVGITAAGLARRRDDAGALAACGYLVFGFFVVGSGVHERYDLPALAFLIPAMLAIGRWRPVVAAISATITVNALLGSPLDRLYPQGNPAWLTLVVSTANVALLGWATVLILYLVPAVPARAPQAPAARTFPAA